MNPQEALNNLYTIARKAPLSADDHDQVRKLAETILEALPKEEVEEVKETKKK